MPDSTPDETPDETPDPGGRGQRALLDELTARLGGARHEARFILDEALCVPDGGVDGKRARPGTVPADAATRARDMADRRVAGEPLQYIFGHWSFRGLDLCVDPRVLIPRPETEQVVEVALGEARRLVAASAQGGLVLVDAGTGSGAIALALAAELGPDHVHEVWATDTSTGALDVAAANLAACRRGATAAEGATGGASGGPAVDLPLVELVAGSWLTPLPERLRGRVDLVVSNPPYVTEDEWSGLTAEVRAEPRQALVAGPSRMGEAGLADVEAVLEQSVLWLRPCGAVVIELAPHQAEAAECLAVQLGYDQVRIEPDLAGRPRALAARLLGAQGSE